jgi:hypothetical protein
MLREGTAMTGNARLAQLESSYWFTVESHQTANAEDDYDEMDRITRESALLMAWRLGVVSLSAECADRPNGKVVGNNERTQP